MAKSLKPITHLIAATLVFTVIAGCKDKEESTVSNSTSQSQPTETEQTETVEKPMAAPTTPIWTAAATGDLQTLTDLLDAGTDINSADPQGSTPLLVAVLFGQIEAVKLLIEKGADLNANNTYGATALHIAALFGRVEVVELLLTKGADKEIRDQSGATTLDLVAGEFSVELKGLIQLIAQSFQVPADMSQIEAARPQIAKLLGKPTSTTNNPQIWIAIALGDVEAVKQILAAGTDVNVREPANNGTPLLAASLFGHKTIVEMLIEKGAELDIRNKDGSTCLQVAALFGHTDTVKLLLEKDADASIKNPQGLTALDIVAGDFDGQMIGVIQLIAGLVQMEVDLAKIKAARPEIAAVLREHQEKK